MPLLLRLIPAVLDACQRFLTIPTTTLPSDLLLPIGATVPIKPTRPTIRRLRETTSVAAQASLSMETSTLPIP